MPGATLEIAGAIVKAQRVTARLFFRLERAPDRPNKYFESVSQHY